MKKEALLFVAVSMLAAFTACGSNADLGKRETQAEYGTPQEDTEPTMHENMGDDTAVYEYETDIIRYGEVAGAFSLRKDVERTQTDCAVYYFETSISEQERQACIAATERALSCIDGMWPDVEIAVFTSETLDGIAVSGSRLYTPVRQWNSAEYLADVLLAAYSEWGNYGLAYGYADYLCRKVGMYDGEAASYDRANDGFQPMSSPELYDLNLLCFDENFVSPEDVEEAKNNACYFVSGYLSTHSEEELLKLLSDSGTVEGVGRANEALEAFYAENGAECDLTEIRYRYGGVTYDYAAACEYAQFYLDKEWQDLYWKINAEALENFLHEDYSEIRAFFECNARQMGQYQEFFGFDSYNNDLSVILTEIVSMTVVSYYSCDSHTIYLGSIFSLSHEYIHSIMYGRCDFEIKWKCEGCARYFETKYNDYYYDYYCIKDVYYMEQDDVYTQKFLASLDALGRTIDTLDIKKDLRMLEDLCVYVYGYTDPNATYEAGASFIGYLVDQYGERAVIQYICSENGYSTEWGKSYEELVQDWNNYINENYSWYGAE